MVATAHPEAHKTDPMEVELVAIFRGMQFSIPLGIPNLIVESDDCLLAVKALEDGVESIAAHQHMLLEILKLKSYFVVCDFNYVS